MDTSQSISTREMDGSSQSVSVLPPPPSGIYGQFDSTIDQPFSMQKNGPTYYRHHPNHAFMQGPGHNPLLGVSRRNETASSNGEAVPFGLGSGSYQPEQYTSGFTEQTTFTSPQTTFAFAISSPKREADVHSGQFAKHNRSGSFKRQRVDLSISTDLPYTQTHNQQPPTTMGQQQHQYGHLSQPGSAVFPHAMSMNPPSSANSQSQADMSMSDDNVDSSRVNSLASAGNQPLLGNTSHLTQAFQNAQLHQFSPGSVGNGDTQPVQPSFRHNSFPQMQPQSPMQISSYTPVMSSLTSSMPVNGSSLGQSVFNPAYSMTQPISAPSMSNGPDIRKSSDPNINARFTLVMRQQPERARLCSFKEENDTIDRRPVDPPPIVEIIPNSTSSISEMLVQHHLFMKAILVAPHPEFTMNLSDFSPTRKQSHIFQELRLPAGQEATTGEATQTPEKLQDLEGKEGAFCVFGRLSIRMPGHFRLRFVLYETTQYGIQDLGFVISEPFEVFSPKLFGGMRQSTTLTRHFASQGLKIKLRQDGTSRSGRRKKAQPTERSAKETNALENVVAANDTHQKRDSSSRKQQDSMMSSRNTLSSNYGQGTQRSDAASPPQRAFPSITPTDVKSNPAFWPGDGNSIVRYPAFSHDAQNASTFAPAIASLSQRLSTSNGFMPQQSAGFQNLSNFKMEIPPNHTSEGTLSTIEFALDSSPNEKRSGGSGSSAGDVDFAATASEATPKSASSVKGKTALPSIGRAMQESSIWLNKAGLVPPDEMVAGGIAFRNGIRYGGDDGFMPPMSFGRLPGLIYEGILPSTPGISTGTDLSNFSLKNRLGNPSLSPYPMMKNSTPPPPGKSINNGLIQYLNNSTFTEPGHSSRGETSNGASSSLRSDKGQTATQKQTSGDSGALVKPSQFADLDEKLDVAAAHGVEGFCAALSSSLESKVRSFTLALPRRASRDSKGSLVESMRDISGERQQSMS